MSGRRDDRTRRAARPSPQESTLAIFLDTDGDDDDIN
jgi:hypothetical protein